MKKTLLTIFTIFGLFLLVGCTGKDVTVSFVVNGGTPVKTLTVAQESTIDLQTTTKEGYTFTGWYTDATLSTLFNFDDAVIRNMTLYAGWSVNAYTITFVFDNGNENDTFTANFGTAITYPTNPTKEGHTFGGWYMSQTYTTEFNSTSVPSSNLSVYAYWIPNVYTVNFYLDNTSVPTYTEQVTFGMDVVNIPSIPLVTGSDGAWDQELTNITSNLEVHLVYTKQVFTISFADENGTVYDTVNVEYGDTITPPSTREKVGYDFIGYFSETLNRNIDLSIYTVTENLTLQDVFQIETYSVRFYGGENGSLLGSVEYINYGSSATAPTTGLDKIGYTFAGWDIDFSSVSEDLVVTATYTINQYDVVFDANGGEFADASTTLTVTKDYNANVTVPEVPTKEGFIFIGWFKQLTDVSDFYFGTGIAMPEGGFTVYAKWVELIGTTYTVSGTYYFEQEDISVDQLSTLGTYTQTSSEAYTPFINVYYNTEMTPVRSIEGYSFYKLVYQGNEYFDPSMLLTITEDETVDVYYRKVVVTVSFTDRVDGENQTTAYYTYYNSSILNPPTPTPVAGMTVAWERQNFTNIKSNLSIAAIQYDNSLQTVIFTSNGSIIYIATNQPDLFGTIDAHAMILALDSPIWTLTQSGYRFEGWFIAGTNTLVSQNILYFDDSYFTTNSTTIEARWTKLDQLSSPTDAQINVNTTDSTITITFNVNPTLVGETLTYPTDYIFILNGQTIMSIPATPFIDVLVQNSHAFTLTLTPSSPYYVYFSDLLNPGMHTLQIISVGDNTYTLSSHPSNVIDYTVKSLYDGIPESADVKDYYIIEDFGSGTLRYIFYTNLTYQFTGLSFTIETGSNHIFADGNILRTSSIPGDFTFTITDTTGSRTYQGLVVEDIRQFNIGPSYQNYMTETDTSLENDSFLQNNVSTPYYAGASNAFYLDMLIRNNNGLRIPLADVLLDYTFYLNGSEVALTEAELASYVIIDKNVMNFTNLAVGNDFKIVVEPRYEALQMDMDPLIYMVTVNDGYNAFTNAELKALFADFNVHTINIQRDITASLNSNQLYSDGSPINFLATPTNDYENCGNVYARIKNGTDNDSIVIEGNFMTIDGTDLPYINPNLTSTIPYSTAFQIVSTQIGLFYYNVLNTTPVNNNEFTMSNLRLLGNTTTPSINYAGSEEEIANQERLMSQNSGGILGVVVRNGKADLTNMVIAYTVIGVTTNAYGENSSALPLTVDLSYVSIYDSWANSVYLWGGAGLEIDHSSIGSSGGAAIHFEDIHPGTTGYDDPLLVIGEGNEFNNWISGQEAWFKAYAMTSVALALKSNINSGIDPLGKTIIQMMENPVTGYDTEMINLVFLSLPMTGAVTYSNPNDTSSVISASEVSFNIADATGSVTLNRDWNFTTKLWPLSAEVAIPDPRISGGQYGFALGKLSDTYAFLQMITDIKTFYYQTYGGAMSDADAGNLASIAGFYNLTAPEALQVGGYVGAGYSIPQAVSAIKGSLDYPQPQFIEVIAPIALTGAAGNATVLIEMFNKE
ncbi:MAG: InlB B-repeat-containing protein [Candidatus Izemoplasmatales bacterium]